MLENLNVFISYARKDGIMHAEILEKALADIGIKTWRDKRELDPWQDFTSQIEDAINQSTHVVICLTAESKRDDSFVRREIQAALLHKPAKPIITLRFADIQPHIHVNTLSWIDCFANWKLGFEQLVTWLERPVVAHKIVHISEDPYRPYVEKLSLSTTQMLRRTVFNAEVIPLVARDTPDAVKSAFSANVLAHLPSWFGELHAEKRFENFGKAFEYYRQRLLLLGEPGSGKTTTLLSFVRDVCYQRLSDPKSLLPIYAMIASWDGKTEFFSWLSRESELEQVRLMEEIQAGRVLLLLDGLDEQQVIDILIPHPSKRDYRIEFVRMLQSIPQTPCLLTCRIKDYEEIVHALGDKVGLNGAVTLIPLNELQIKEHLSETPELQLAILNDPALLEMARTPLLLTLLVISYLSSTPEQRSELATLSDDPTETQSRLFELYVQRRYEFEALKHSLSLTVETVLSILGELALVDLDRKPSSLGEISIENFQNSVSQADVETLVSITTHLNLLIRLDDGKFRFIHLLLRNSLARRYARQHLFSENRDVKLQCLFALGSLRDTKSSVLILKLFDDPDFWIRIQAYIQYWEFHRSRDFSGSSRFLTFLAILSATNDLYFAVLEKRKDELLGLRLMESSLKLQVSENALTELRNTTSTSHGKILEIALTKETSYVRNLYFQFVSTKVTSQNSARITNLLSPLINNADPEIAATAKEILERVNSM